jgi:hypothetical protein
MPSTTNLEREEIVDDPGKDGNMSMPEQVKRSNPWRKRKMMMMMMMMIYSATYKHASPHTCNQYYQQRMLFAMQYIQQHSST